MEEIMNLRAKFSTSPRVGNHPRKSIRRIAPLAGLLLALFASGIAIAQGSLPYYWGASVEDQFDFLPHYGYRQNDSDVLSFTFWQGGSSFIGEDPASTMHMQAIARYDLNGVPYFFISRNGNPLTAGTDHPGELYVIRMGSQSGSGGEALGETCSENNGSHCKPYLTNKTVHSFLFTNDNMILDSEDREVGWKHGGGMQVYDHYLLVALEKTCDTVLDPDYPTDEKYQFYCTGDEEKRGAIGVFDLSQLDTCPSSNCLPLVGITTTYKNASGVSVDLPTMGAVGVTQVQIGGVDKFLFTHSSGDMTDWTFMTADALYGDEPEYLGLAVTPHYYTQTANFVHSVPDGELYLVTTRSLTSTPEGWDYINLYQIDYDPSPALNEVAEYHVELEQADGIVLGDFTAVGGVYLSPTGRLILYSGPYDNDDWDLGGDGCVNPAHTELCKAVDFGELVSDFGEAPVLATSDQTGESNENKTFTLGSFTDDYYFIPPDQYLGCIGYDTRIDWGDGSPVTNLVLTRTLHFPDPVQPVQVTAAHTYTSAGTFTGSVEVQDCEGFQASEPFEAVILDINDPPSGTDNTLNLLEDTPHTFAAVDFGFTDPADSPPNNLNRVRITTLPTAGTMEVSGSAVSAGDYITAANIPHLVFTPAADASGTPYTSFTFQVEDDGGTADGGVNLDPTPNTITINITAVNDEPIFGSSGVVTVWEDSGPYSSGWAFGIDDGDPEVSQVLSFVVTGNTNPGLFSVSPAITPSGTLSFTPAANGTGSANISVELRDDGGTANGGDDTYGPTVFTISVTAINDEPSFSSGGNVTVGEDSGAYSAAWASSISDGDPEVTQTLTFVITANTDPTLFSAGPAITSGGVLSFTTAGNASGSASLEVELRDNGGTANGGDDTYGPVSFTITISSANDAPTDISLSANAIDENLPAGTLVGNLSASDPDTGDSHAFSLRSGVPGCSSSGNSAFQIPAGTNQLQSAVVFDYETPPTSYDICIRTTDSGGLTYDEQFTITINDLDDTPPQLTAFLRDNPASSPTNADTLIFRATFDEAVQHVNISDFLVTGGTTAGVTAVTVLNSSTYYITVSGGDLASYNGTVGLDLGAGQNIADLAGNPLPAGEPVTDEIYLVDNTSAAITAITRQDPLASPTNAIQVTFRVTFSEDVQNLDPSDFDLGLSGTANGTINAATVVSGSIYDLVIGGVGGDGVLDLNIAPGNDISDLSSNPLGASPAIGSEETYTIDNTSPAMIFGSTSVPPLEGAILITRPSELVIQYNEAVQDGGGPGAADSLDNYLLLRPGPNHIYDTAVDNTTAICGSGHVVTGDDVKIGLLSASYDPASHTATLQIDPAFAPLISSQYRLYICGAASVDDLAGNPINAGANIGLNFIVWPARSLPDTGFAPGTVTLLPEQSAALDYQKSSLVLEIPKLGVDTDIVGIPYSDGSWNVSWLGSRAGWLEGTAFPTWAGNAVLTGHVYDANGLPGPFLDLSQLSYGDRIIIQAWGQEYIYEVRSVSQVLPDEIAGVLRHEQQPWLTLITCRGYDPLGDSYHYRVIIRAVQVAIR